MLADSTKLGVCIETVKDIVYGREVRNWILAGVILALMNADDIGSTCPFCRKSFDSKQGLVNHILRSSCYNELKKVCVKAYEVDNIIAGRYSSKTSKRVRLYMRNGDSIVCDHGDYRCVARSIRSYITT
jgi:hypothetical protein